MSVKLYIRFSSSPACWPKNSTSPSVFAVSVSAPIFVTAHLYGGTIIVSNSLPIKSLLPFPARICRPTTRLWIPVFPYVFRLRSRTGLYQSFVRCPFRPVMRSRRPPIPLRVWAVTVALFRRSSSRPPLPSVCHSHSTRKTGNKRKSFSNNKTNNVLLSLSKDKTFPHCNITYNIINT